VSSGEVVDKVLKKDALGFVSSVVIGVAHLAEALQQAEQAGVAARGELVNAKPSDGLVELADQVDAQMIVVGSYGEAPLKGAIIGSTAHKLLHLSERPVLVVRAA
jgi:nucleotide-binding universal stress UspA family protein